MRSRELIRNMHFVRQRMTSAVAWHRCHDVITWWTRQSRAGVVKYRLLVKFFSSPHLLAGAAANNWGCFRQLSVCWEYAPIKVRVWQTGDFCDPEVLTFRERRTWWGAGQCATLKVSKCPRNLWSVKSPQNTACRHPSCHIKLFECVCDCVRVCVCDVFRRRRQFVNDLKWSVSHHHSSLQSTHTSSCCCSCCYCCCWWWCCYSIRRVAPSFTLQCSHFWTSSTGCRNESFTPRSRMDPCIRGCVHCGVAVVYSIQDGPKNWHHFCTPQLYQILTDFQNYFTARIRRKFVIILSLKIPLHPKCVATLPCEMTIVP